MQALGKLTLQQAALFKEERNKENNAKQGRKGNSATPLFDRQ